MVDKEKRSKFYININSLTPEYRQRLYESLEREVDELNEINQNLFERVCDVLMENMELRAKLVQCHNKNTELKGDIARRIDASKD
jgi:hypothetical protein